MKPDSFIQDHIGPAAIYEQLAEECMELGKEALKYARIIRRENPTPATKKGIMFNIQEEFNDVLLVACLLKLEANTAQMNFKLKRWEERIEEMEENS